MWWWMGLAMAGEGMWLPEQVPAMADDLTEAGFQIPATSLSDPLEPPLAAVVGLGGYCSASFVSPDGLVLTNLHCVDGLLSQASEEGEDLLVEGFTASSRAAERPAGPAARLYVLETVSDVGDPIRAAFLAAGVSDGDRIAVRDRAIATIVAKCERKAGRRCQVASFDGGASYRLLQSLEIKDVRVVHSSPAAIGYYGGDQDNFEWPRHDADFAILRAYTGRNGKPAAPSDRNVPLRPSHWLPVDSSGVAPGDPVMVVGYPAGTERLKLAEELHFSYEVVDPALLEVFREDEAILEEEAASSPEVAARLAPERDGIANYRKYIQGLQDNVGGSTVLADKDALRVRVDAVLADDPERRARVEELRALVAEAQAEFPLGFALDGLLESSLLDVAHTAVRWAGEREKRKDLDREPGLQDRDREDLVASWTELDETLWLPSERRLLRASLDRYLALPEAERVAALDAWLDARGGADGALDVLFADPALAAAPARVALLDQSRAALSASEDPWVQLAVLLEEAELAPARQRARTRDGAGLRLRPVWVEVVREVQGGRSYPDANSTLRLTFGAVEGYEPRDGLVATPITRVQGIVQKSRRPGYEAPQWLLDSAADSAASPWAVPDLGDVPVDFLSTVDTTGGNSGSPTLNARGELVGLLFDGNYESMAADWQFDPAVTRSVHVDVRYIGWLLAQDPDAAWILDELKLHPARRVSGDPNTEVGNPNAER